MDGNKTSATNGLLSIICQVKTLCEECLCKAYFFLPLQGSEKCIDSSSPVHSDDECDVAYSVSASAVSILQKLVQADMEFGYLKPGHGTKGRQECFFFFR